MLPGVLHLLAAVKAANLIYYRYGIWKCLSYPEKAAYRFRTRRYPKQFCR